MKLVACSTVVLALALTLAAQAAVPYKPKAGEKVDEKKGVAIGQKAAAAAGPVTCTLTFNPATVTNGQVTNYTVTYGGGGCVNGQIVEAIWLYWPTTVAGFGELTIRKKMLTVQAPGCLVASFEAVVAPSALGIKGAFKPTADVRDWTGKFICSATGSLTIN